MILVDWQLLDRIDIRLGDHFVWYTPSDKVIDPHDRDTIASGVEETEADDFVIRPGAFVLARTLECIELPDNIVATIEGKSSIARLGLTLHQTGGWIDAGFRGTITLEMCNVNTRPVRVYAGMSIGQLVFYTTERAANPYYSKGDAKYMDQKQATLSRYHVNRKKG